MYYEKLVRDIQTNNINVMYAKIGSINMDELTPDQINSIEYHLNAILHAAPIQIVLQ